MTDSLRLTRRDLRHRPLAHLGLGLALVVGSGTGNAVAATITSHKNNPAPQIHISGHAAMELKAFLAGGPAHWAVTPPPKFPAGLVITNPNGSLKTNSVVAFLTWKRDRNPTFFDKHHPRIAPLFQHQAQTLRQAQAKHLASKTISQPSHSSAFQVLTDVPTVGNTNASKGAVTVSATPASTSTPSPNVQETLAPTPVPEPSAMASALALFGLAGGWWRLRRP